jgi:hypothetical protein
MDNGDRLEGRQASLFKKAGQPTSREEGEHCLIKGPQLHVYDSDRSDQVFLGNGLQWNNSDAGFEQWTFPTSDDMKRIHETFMGFGR